MPHRPAGRVLWSTRQRTRSPGRWVVRLLVAIGFLAGSWLLGALIGGDTAAADQCPVTAPVLRTGAPCPLADSQVADPSPNRSDAPSETKPDDDNARLPDIVGTGLRHPDRTLQTATRLSRSTFSAVTTGQTHHTSPVNDVRSITGEILATPLASTARRITDHLPTSGLTNMISGQVLTTHPVRSVTAPPVGSSNDPPAKAAPARTDRPVEAHSGKPVAAPRTGPTPHPHKPKAGNGYWTTSRTEGLPSPTKTSSCTPSTPIGDGTTSAQAGTSGVVALSVNAGRVVPRGPTGPAHTPRQRSPRSRADLPTVFPD